ncbi:MAG: RNase adapter RapZ [Acidobacteria bacterium]|nr:RNase adapter RapZ [Acidobacteriota bacterium]
MSKRRREAKGGGRVGARGRRAPDIVVITGLSGSGMSSATDAFEDLGYFCVDNLPLTLLPTFARLVKPEDDEGESDAEDEKPHIRRAALVINIRERHFLSEFEGQIARLRRATGLDVAVIFFEASDEALQRRFSETRRPHPYDQGDGLPSSIRAEREAMADIRSHADLIVDTTEHNVHSLRHYLVERFSPNAGEAPPMRVQILSFGYKYGGPRDVDLMFDVRHLPNPHFVPELRPFSGADARVARFIKSKPETAETLRRFGELVDYLLPLYRREGKSYVTVGVGCTGGRHRSVMTANELARHLRREGYEVTVVHRDLKKTKRVRS